MDGGLFNKKSSVPKGALDMGVKVRAGPTLGVQSNAHVLCFNTRKHH